MAKRSIYGSLLGSIILAFACNGARDNSGAQAEVLKVDDDRFAARANGHVEAMSRIYSDDYTLISAEGDLRTKDDQIHEMRSQQLKFSPPQILDRTVRVHGDSAVVLTHERPSIIRNGQEIGGNFRMSRVYVKRNGGWQLVSTQATRIAEGPTK